MDVAKLFWAYSQILSQKEPDFYLKSDKTPHQRSLELLESLQNPDGERILNKKKTKINTIIMPIFEDLDVFELKLVKMMLKIKKKQEKMKPSTANFDMQYGIKVSREGITNIKESYLTFIPDIIKEFAKTRQEIENKLIEINNRESVTSRIESYFRRKKRKERKVLGSYVKKCAVIKDKLTTFKKALLEEGVESNE